MAGGGVNASNAKSLLSAGVHALHFTARKVSSINNAEGMGKNYETDADKIKSVIQSLG
jgi:copper homeostasis protein CutC